MQLPSTHWLLSWIPEAAHPGLRSLLAGALRLGPRPQHMAFIMDGNRRSARQRSLPVRVGHEEGFEALKRVLGFLLKLGVPHVTVYAFSIENFNRDPREVDTLLEMARTRLVELCEKGELLDRHGVQIRIVGRRDLLPVDVQEACARAEALTAHNNQGILNLCCPYTSQEEIATAIRRSTAEPAESITADKVSSNLYTSASPPLDILMRTSGVHRLSDFLLWQTNESAVLHFVPVNWPDIGVLDVLPPLLQYQAESLAGQLCSLFSSSRDGRDGEK
ncbi:hypothetical protein ACM66B_001063 [Microbotryomycetes sp. NB124-2]